MTSQSRLTIFSVPKAFKDHVGIIQRNAIQSWVRLKPACEIILLGDDEGTPEVAEEYGLRHLPRIKRNEFGTPLISSVFEEAEKAATREHMCYVNADIIFMSDFLPAVERVLSAMTRCLIVGQRCDLEITEPIDFSAEWEQRVRLEMAERGKLLGPSGADYFVYPRGLWGEIPAFAIGRAGWDNWIIYRAVSQNVPVIDLTPTVVVVHPKHDYTHLPAEAKTMWSGPETQQNRALAGGYLRAFTLRDVPYELTPKGVRRRWMARYNRRFINFVASHRPLSWLLKLMRVCVARLRGEDLRDLPG